MCHPEVVMSSLSSQELFSWSIVRDHFMSFINFVLEHHLHLKVFVLVSSFPNYLHLQFLFFTTMANMNFVIMLPILISVTKHVLILGEILAVFVSWLQECIITLPNNTKMPRSFNMNLSKILNWLSYRIIINRIMQDNH